MKKLLALFLTLSMMISQAAWAQEDEEDLIKSTQNDILLVAAAGAAGAVLGLSTLSFVDQPSKHLGNIWTGAAIGVIAGVVFVAYNSAQKGQEELLTSRDFRTSERLAWHQKHSKLTMPSVQFGTNIWTANF